MICGSGAHVVVLCNQGSMEETRSRYLSEIEIYTKKQEFVKQFCPIIIFPEFTFWNEVITEEKMQ